MPQTRACDVSPTGDQEKYSVALLNRAGEWYGLDIPLTQIYPNTNNVPPPIERVDFVSYHAGRGYDKFLPNQNGFYDSLNGWASTPGKYHATLQKRFGRGLRDADFNMPAANNVTFKKLVGGQSYLAAKFTASAGYTAKKIIVIIRKNVPAGTVGAPSNLTVALYSDSAGLPNVSIVSASLVADSIDVNSQYYVFDVSTTLTNATAYWVVLFTASADKDNACWEVACDPTVAGAKKQFSGGSFSATTFSPYFRVTDANPARQHKQFILDGALYLAALFDDGTTATKLFLNGNRGRATGTQASNKLQDTSHGAYGTTAWPTDRFKDSFVRIIRGTGQSQVRQITANSGNELTVSPPWDVQPVSGSTEYIVFACDWFVEIGTTGLGVVTDTPIVHNGFVYFPQGDSTVIRKMKIDYADADVHAWGSESATNNNKAYYLETGHDLVEGPQIWRGNILATSGSTPNAAAISVSRASSAPINAGTGVPTPVAFTADLTFKTAILVGDNTSLITNLHEHEGVLQVFKEDGFFMVQNDRAVRVKMGVEVAPDIDNGRASITAGDKNLYVAFRNDVYIVTGGGAYSTNLKYNLPSDRSGPVRSLAAAEGWVFAGINAGVSNTSSVMKFSLDTKTWSEQLRGYFPGYRIRNLQWQPCPETRNRLWIDIQGDMMYQQFPLNGVRPFDDKGIPYEHETDIILPTVDLLTTDPKYYALLTTTSQGLATEADIETGHVIVVECQTDNDVGTNTWEHVGYITTSPSASVKIDRGEKRMLRIRLRLISDEPADPVILEAVSMTLFARHRLIHEWSIQFPIQPDDDEQNSVDLLMWLRRSYYKGEPLKMLSRFTLWHDRDVTLVDEPRYQLDELDAPNNELESQVWMKLAEVL